MDQIKTELGNLEQVAKQIERDANISASGNRLVTSEFEKLNGTEQSAASLGVNPEEWKPIAFMNQAHYEQLKAANMLDGTLARRIEAFKVVSAS